MLGDEHPGGLTRCSTAVLHQNSEALPPVESSEPRGFRSSTSNLDDPCALHGGSLRRRVELHVRARANKSSTRLPFVQQNVDVPVPQITVELEKDITEQPVDAPMPQIMRNLWQFCRSFHSLVRMLACSFSGGIVEVTQFIPQERIVVVPQFQERILEVAKNNPQERAQLRRRTDRGMPVAQIMVKMWR